MRLLYSLLVIVLLAGCSKKDKEDVYPGFVPGEIILGAQESTTLVQLFDLANAYKLPIKEVSSCLYTTTISKDSADYVKNIVRSKPYCNTPEWPMFVRTQVNALQVGGRFLSMPLAAQQDWLATARQLRLQEVPITKSCTLQVPVGQELAYVAQLQKTPGLAFVQPNHYVRITLH
jgi:hypothetical protein